MHDFYVQVRYRQGERWVTIAAAGTRQAAASLGSDALRRRAMQVRIASRSQLVSEGGQDAVLEAEVDLAAARSRDADDDGGDA